MSLSHNFDLERSFLGGCLLVPARVGEHARTLRPSHFAHPRHAALWRVLLDAWTAERPLDVTMLLDEPAVATGELGEVNYLLALPQACVNVDLLAHYAERIVKHARRRTLTLVRTRWEEKEREGATDEEVLAMLSRALEEYRADLGATEDGWRTIQEAAVEAERDLLDRRDGEGPPRLRTGIAQIDDVLVMSPGEMGVIAARPGMGKSVLADQIAENVARDGYAVGFVALEMSARELGSRILSRTTEITTGRMRYPESLGERDIHRIGHERLMLGDLPYYVDDRPAATVGQIEERAMALRRRVEARGLTLRLLVVDYLQLMQGGKGENRATVVADISRGLKLLAKRLDIVVVAVAQLNRDVEGRAEKIPRPSDLKESGGIEQDADFIVLLHRPETENPKLPERPGVVVVNLAKQRGGRTALLEIGHRLEVMRIGGVAPSVVEDSW